MKRLTLILALFTVAVVILSAPPVGQNMRKAKTVPPLELFGVPLKSASRDQLRHVFKQNGMQAIREDRKHWIDSYQGVSEGAPEFIAGYVEATDKFAFAVYTLSGDTKLVASVINMVSIKYGLPTSQSGRYDSGPVRAEWHLSQGMEIMVCRGWPDTTTSLIYRDASAFRQMIEEMETVENSQEPQKPRSREHTLIRAPGDK
jgi:hypothetical protein